MSSRDPLALPWKEMGIDLVIEGTGVFVDSKGAGKHIEVRRAGVEDRVRLRYRQNAPVLRPTGAKETTNFPSLVASPASPMCVVNSCAQPRRMVLDRPPPSPSLVG